MQAGINIKIGNKPPKEYLRKIMEQCLDGELEYGGKPPTFDSNNGLAPLVYAGTIPRPGTYPGQKD